MSPHSSDPTNRLPGVLNFNFRTRHAHCTSWTHLHVPIPERKRSNQLMLSLSLLGASRQAYEEANRLLWTTNTFSFEDGRTLKTFVNSLHSTQRKKLTRMHIDFTFDCISNTESQRALNSSLISRLHGLRTLHATISQPNQASVYHDVLFALERMTVLPLQHVTVVIYDIIYARAAADSWLITERQELAERTRGRLLDPNWLEKQMAELREEFMPCIREKD